MSLFNNSVYGSITVDLLKQTDIWKHNEITAGPQKGRVPAHVLRSLLDLCGFDLTSNHKKPFSSFKKMIRHFKEPTKGYETVIFNGRIKDDCSFKSLYSKTDIVTSDIISGDKLIKLQDFGLDRLVWQKLN
jgi:hypothetical protein